MSIAYDRVVPSAAPEKWDLARTGAIASTIGLVGVASTFFLLFLADTCTVCVRAPAPSNAAPGSRARETCLGVPGPLHKRSKNP